MSEEIIYKKGDKVVFKSQASWGHVWIVKAVNLKQKRCSLRRVTPDSTFEKSSAFKFLMLEADLPRRVTTERPVKMPVKKYKQKDNSLVLTFERVAKILKLVHENKLIADNPLINQHVMPDATLRTVQRHTEDLCDAGYLERITYEKKKHRFYVTPKALEILNLTDNQNKTSGIAPCEPVNEHSVQ